MATYFFHIHRGPRMYVDGEDMALPTASAALQEGRAAAWVLMCDLSDAVKDWSTWRVEVTDEVGRSIVVLPFTHILRVPWRPQTAALQLAKTYE